MESTINTINYLVINKYIKDSICTDDFKELIKVTFLNSEGEDFEIIVGIYKDNMVLSQDNILSREEIIGEIKMQNYTSTYIETITLWSE
jgi:hypothetical protein